MRFVHAQDLVVQMGVNDDYCGSLFRIWHAIYGIDFKSQDIATAGVPRDRPALADITKQMMFRAGGNLLDLQFE